MFEIKDPADIGRIMKDMREMMGISRRELARRIAKATGRSLSSVNAQIWTWDEGKRVPDFTTIAPVLKILGIKLVFVFDEEKDE